MHDSLFNTMQRRLTKAVYNFSCDSVGEPMTWDHPVGYVTYKHGKQPHGQVRKCWQKTILKERSN